jgi:glycosyltransferase involved in cell wall biosynthesis
MIPNSVSSFDLKRLKVAIVHEWFVDYSGSEKVVEQLINLFPDADLFAQVEFLPENLKGFIKNKKVTTSFIQKLPKARTKYRSYLPLMPLAVEQFDMSPYDLIISSNHAVAKGVITGPHQVHISYVHSPIRYAWDLTHQYLNESGLDKGFKGWLAKYFLHRIRLWDYRTANGVDAFVANSRYIARRIKKVYGRQATVIHPPVAVNKFEIGSKKSGYFITASRLAPYKKVDLIVEAFADMPDKKLVVIGDGPNFEKARQKAGPNVTLLGFQPYEVLLKYLKEARAFIFAAEEDFGIAPVEAQACGIPIIAYARGGALETVVENQTGLFFENQDTEDITAAVERFEKMENEFDSNKIRQHAMRFSETRFQREMKRFIEKVVIESVAEIMDIDSESDPDNELKQVLNLRRRDEESVEISDKSE